jgi:hypothetical protein
MKKMETLIPIQRKPQPNNMKVMMMTMLVFQTFVSAVMLCILILLAPEISKTLSDVSVVLPEMKITVEKLGKLVPEVNRGMSSLDKICVALNLNC